MKEEGNVKVKRKQKHFYCVYLYKSIKSKKVEYFIKHVARVPHRISELFQQESVSSRSSFLLSSVLSIKVLVPDTSRVMANS